MFGSLLTAPLRLGIRGAELVIHETLDLSQRALRRLGVVGAPDDRANGHRGYGSGDDDARSRRRPSASPRPEPSAPRRREPKPRPTAATVDPQPAIDPPPTVDPKLAAEQAMRRRAVSESINTRAAEPINAEAAHVSESPELVEEVAEPGAEDGAGAEVRIAEPWEGYRAMRAADIANRLKSASREELAAVELYELSTRNRKSVMAAAQRALKRASPPR